MVYWLIGYTNSILLLIHSLLKHIYNAIVSLRIRKEVHIRQCIRLDSIRCSVSIISLKYNCVHSNILKRITTARWCYGTGSVLKISGSIY